MSLLSLDISRCVRTSNKFSICQKCVDVCPVQTIVITNNLPSFIPNDCVGCAGCLAACPTSSYKLDDFSAIDFIFSHLEKENDIVSCKENIPCLAALSVDEMLSLSLLSEQKILFEKAHCKTCEIATTNLKIIEDRVEEVNFLLKAMEVEKAIVFKEISLNIQEEETVISRRDFLSKATIKDIAKAKHSFDNKVNSLDKELKEHTATNNDIQNIRQKKIPDRRQLLLMAMKRAGVPSTYHNLDIKDISFISQKVIDEDSCTNCQMCYRICPTGALSSNDYGSFISFDAFNCVRCGSCHDVCEPNSIVVKPTFSLTQLFKPETQSLIKFSLKRCNECSMPFTYRGGEVMCNRCRIEEEEAHALWGIK